ncbi:MULTISPECIES: hypothetical protein [Bifidobacterium]|uniref:hypothetical protein n=1 Tax=Bifidobacterium TaxID=1678 RepID=UPI001BDBEDEC|nr:MULTISPECIES: hypothetical protein [Bifidobacterium]MBT1160679.1 hypothetical protein [Bifidobacterium sp. SO1]MBW3079483.1 hypothetical protein [Bifidobacterium simiiventris]
MPQITDYAGAAKTDGRLAYPSIPLGTALQINRQIMSECKHDYIDGTINNAKIARILKQKSTSGSFKGKVYALNKYGLSIREGQLNRVTALGQRLAEQALPQDIFTAFRSYVPFDELYRRLEKNHVIEIAALEEEVARCHRFDAGKTKEFSRVFLKSLEATGKLERIKNTEICILPDEEESIKTDAGAILDTDVNGLTEMTVGQDAPVLESLVGFNGMAEEQTQLTVAKIPAGEIRLVVAQGASYADIGEAVMSLLQLSGKLNKESSNKHVR